MEWLYTIIGIAAAGLTIVGYVTGFFRWVWSNTVGRWKSESPYLPLPTRSVTLLTKGGQEEPWWHMGKSHEQPAMQIVARCKVTNVTRYDILLVAAKLHKTKRLGMVLTRAPRSSMHCEFYIPPGQTTDISLDLWVVPPVRNQGEDFTSDIAVIDQFGNEHWMRRVCFKYR